MFRKQKLRKSEPKSENMEITQKMYANKLDDIIDMELWLTIKQKHEKKLHKLKMDYNRQEQSEIAYIAFDIIIFDICRQSLKRRTDTRFNLNIAA